MIIPTRKHSISRSSPRIGKVLFLIVTSPLHSPTTFTHEIASTFSDVKEHRQYETNTTTVFLSYACAHTKLTQSETEGHPITLPQISTMSSNLSQPHPSHPPPEQLKKESEMMTLTKKITPNILLHRHLKLYHNFTFIICTLHFQ